MQRSTNKHQFAMEKMLTHNKVHSGAKMRVINCLGKLVVGKRCSVAHSDRSNVFVMVICNYAIAR